MVRVITYNNRPDLYPPIYQSMIEMGISRYLSVPHEHLHITSKKGDSWFILELFKLEPFLLVALDAIIVGSLDECVNLGCLTAIEEWKIPGEPNTSLMWVENVEYLLDLPVDTNKYTWDAHAEQRWLKDHAKLEFFPQEWTPSYKYSKITDKSKIVVFHGRPKPHEVGWNV